MSGQSASKSHFWNLNIFIIFIHVPLVALKRILNEPHHEKTCLGFPTRSDFNRAVQPQKMARGLWKYSNRTISSENRALIKCMVTAQLICAFVFAFAKSRFAHDAARIKMLQISEVVNFVNGRKDKKVTAGSSQLEFI